MALDARLNTGLLSEPWWPHLKPESIATYCALLMHGVAKESDGHVEERYLTGRFPLPHVTKAALEELAEVGLLTFTEGGIKVSWEHQTTRKELESKRQRNRERQQNHRDRKKAQAAEGSNAERNALLTRDKRVSNGRVGQDRQGQDRQGQGRGQARLEEEASNDSLSQSDYDPWAGIEVAKPGGGIRY